MLQHPNECNLTCRENIYSKWAVLILCTERSIHVEFYMQCMKHHIHLPKEQSRLEYIYKRISFLLMIARHGMFNKRDFFCFLTLVYADSNNQSKKSYFFISPGTTSNSHSSRLATLAVKNKHKFFGYQYAWYRYPYRKYRVIRICQSHHRFSPVWQSFHPSMQQYGQNSMMQNLYHG